MTAPQPVTDPAGIADAHLEIAVRETLQRHARQGITTHHAVVSIIKAARDHEDTIEALQVQARDHRRDELEQLARDILASFTKSDAGYRARVGQVQIGKWRAVLDGQDPA